MLGIVPQHSISSSAYLLQYSVGHNWLLLHTCLLRKDWDILKKNAGTELNSFYSSCQHQKHFFLCSFYWKTFEWPCQIWLKRIYIFLCEEVIETITVHENRCSYVSFWCIETNTRIHLGEKLCLLSKLIFIEMFCLLNL